MKEMQQRLAALPIDGTERPQGYSMPRKRSGDGTSPPQEPATPWLGKGVLHSFVRSI